MSPEHISTPVPLKNRRKMSHGWLRFLKLIHKGRSQHAEWMLCSPCLYSHLHGTFLCQGNHRTFQGLKGGLATGDTEPMWVKITFREDVDTNHSVPMAQRSENYYALFFKSAMGGQEIAVGLSVFGKKYKMGLWKSLLCLRRANMRGWVIAWFCCGMLRSDERSFPVVKKRQRIKLFIDDVRARL